LRPAIFQIGTHNHSSTDPREGGGGEAYLRQLRQSAADARGPGRFRGPIFDAAVLEEEFGLREFLLIPRWPRRPKLLVSRRSKR